MALLHGFAGALQQGKLQRHAAARCVGALQGWTGCRMLHNANQRRAVAAAMCLETASASALAPSSSSASSNRGTTASASKPRLRVAVDVDEVLGRFVHTLNKFCLDEYGMEYSVGDYSVYEFAKIWGCSQERSNHIVHEFFRSQHFNNGIPVIPGALQALQRLSTGCDLVVVTSRQHIIQDVTLSWIDSHYPGIFQEVYFGNHWALEGVSRKKSDICRSIGAHVLIDDNPSYATECAAAGISVLLYDWDMTYPWSKLPTGVEVSPLIQVVQDWDDVELALAHMSPKLL